MARRPALQGLQAGDVPLAGRLWKPLVSRVRARECGLATLLQPDAVAAGYRPAAKSGSRKDEAL